MKNLSGNIYDPQNLPMALDPEFRRWEMICRILAEQGETLSTAPSPLFRKIWRAVTDGRPNRPTIN